MFTMFLKSRWNACHALANLLHCSSFPIGQASYTPSVFKSLTNVIHTSKNFKVRIAAASALGEMKSLGQFGGDKAEQRQTLKLVVTSLQDALAKTDDLVDSNFGEFKYQDQLKEQLTLTLVKLQSLDPSSPSSNGTLDKL